MVYLSTLLRIINTHSKQNAYTDTVQILGMTKLPKEFPDSKTIWGITWNLELQYHNQETENTKSVIEVNVYS